jgi:hypothetical protein
MKTELKRTKLSGAIFIFIQAKTNTETSETKIEANIVENRYTTKMVHTERCKTKSTLESCQKKKTAEFKRTNKLVP